MEQPRLDEVGNLQQRYSFPTLSSTFRGLCFDPSEKSPSWIVKSYALKHLKTNDENCASQERVQRLLMEEFERGSLEKGLGLGFLVSSEGMVNLNIWRSDIPEVPMQTIWKKTRYSRHWKKADLNLEHSYCIGEGAIYASERYAWQSFLRSRRGNDQKQSYISNVLPDGPVI